MGMKRPHAKSSMGTLGRVLLHLQLIKVDYGWATQC